jgi:hypothetical protein
MMEVQGDSRVSDMLRLDACVHQAKTELNVKTAVLHLFIESIDLKGLNPKA